MKVHSIIKIMVGLTAVLLVLGLSQAFAGSHNNVYTMTGKVSAVDLSHHTVVVQIPVNHQEMTVAGPLTQNAMLKKMGHSVALQAFSVGERVTVTWEKDKDGLYIRRLIATS
jgi:hypothetical protein